MEAAPAAVPVAAVETTPVAPAPVTMEQQVVYQQSSPVPQEVTMQAMPAQPQVMAQPQPVMQTVPVQTMQTAPVQPVQQAPVMEATPAPVTAAAPITPDTTGVTINFSNAVQQPVATPMTQEVQQQVMTQPVEPVVQPVVETQATVSQEPTIQFFPADNFSPHFPAG